MSSEPCRARTATILIAALALAGCHTGASSNAAIVVDTLAGGTVRVRNPARGLWDAPPASAGSSPTRWSLVEDLRLGSVSGDSTELFEQVVSLAVDRAGRIYVLDRQAATVMVFAPDGTYLRSLGRRGQGPGELANPWGLAVDSRQRIWVIDMGNARYSVFDTTGALVEEKHRFTGGQVAPWPGAVLDDGRVVDVDLGRTSMTFTVHEPDGKLQDTVVLPAFDAPELVVTNGPMRASAPVPFAPRLLRLFDPRGYLWTAVNDDYRIVQRDVTGGDSLRIVQKAYDPVPVTDAEADTALRRLDWFRKLGGRTSRSRIPDHHPPFTSFFVDDAGYLWVEPVTPTHGRASQVSRGSPSVFDVFDDEGRYLGRLDAGLPLYHPMVAGSALYGVTSDTLGVQYVVRMRIEGR